MPFLQPHKRRGNTLNHIALAIPLALAILVSIISPRWLSALFLKASVPAFHVRFALAQTAEALRTRLKSRDELQAENDALLEENMKLRMKAALYDEARADYENLASIVRSDETENIILAHVISAPNKSPYDTFIIDAGSASGVRVGDVVGWSDTVAVGIIEETTGNASRVRLYSSPGIETDVSIGSDSFLTTAEGSGGGMFELHVPKDIEISDGDALRLPTQGARTIGYVRDVVAEDADAFQVVYATLPVNLFETRDILVVPAGSLDL